MNIRVIEAGLAVGLAVSTLSDVNLPTVHTTEQRDNASGAHLLLNPDDPMVLSRRILPFLVNGDSLSQADLDQYLGNTLSVGGEPVIIAPTQRQDLDQAISNNGQTVTVQTEAGKMTEEFGPMLSADESAVATFTESGITQITTENELGANAPTLLHVTVNGTQLPDMYLTDTGRRPIILPNGQVVITNSKSEVITGPANANGYNPRALEDKYFLRPRADIIAQDVQNSQGISATPDNVDIIPDSKGQPGVALMKQGSHALNSTQLAALDGYLRANGKLVLDVENSGVDVVGQNPAGSNPVDNESGTLYISNNSGDPIKDFNTLEKFIEGAE